MLQSKKSLNTIMDNSICPPAHLLPFLTAKGSLTALLEQKAGQPLRVQIIYEGHQSIDFYHKKLLNLPLHRPALAWVREVLLFGNETKAWVRAKSIFPMGSLSGNAKRLRHLKNKPIGYVMFKKNHQLPHKRTIFFDEHWGRNTVYDWHGRQILVQEIFLAM